jgi:hypothetical protein
MNEAVTSYRILPTGQAQHIWHSNNHYDITAPYFLFTATFKNVTFFSIPANVVRYYSLKDLKFYRPVVTSHSYIHHLLYTHILTQPQIN